MATKGGYVKPCHQQPLYVVCVCVCVRARVRACGVGVGFIQWWEHDQ